MRGYALDVGFAPVFVPKIFYEPQRKRVITPVDSSHRVVMMAIERGQLQT